MILLRVFGNAGSDGLRPPQKSQWRSGLQVVIDFAKRKLAISLEADFLKVLASNGSKKHL